MSIIPFSNVKTKDLKLALLVARIGFVLGILSFGITMSLAIDEMFFEISRVTWSEGVKTITRGYGIQVFAGYWPSLISTVFMIFSSSALAVFVSFENKNCDKTT